MTVKMSFRFFYKNNIWKISFYYFTTGISLKITQKVKTKRMVDKYTQNNDSGTIMSDKRKFKGKRSAFVIYCKKEYFQT